MIMKPARLMIVAAFAALALVLAAIALPVMARRAAFR